jgi:hypothetical protein
MAVRPPVLLPFPQGNSPVPRPIPSVVNANSLAASVAESITVPTGARYVLFSCTANFYINCYTTATVPGDTTDGTASDLNPAGYQLTPNEAVTLSVISPSACVITASFYS